MTDRPRLVPARPAPARQPRPAGGARRATSRVVPGLLLRRAPAPRAATPPARARSSCSSAWTSSRRSCASAAAGCSSAHGQARARAADAGEGDRRDAVHFAYDVSPFARERGERIGAALRRRRDRGPLAPRGLNAVDVRDGIAHPGRASPTRSSRPFHRNWLEDRRAARCSQAPREVAGPAGPAKRAAARRSTRPRARAGGRATRRPAARPRRASASTRFLAADVEDYADNHDALGARPHLAPVAISALRLHLAAPDRGAAAARQGAGGVPPPALLARLLPPRPLPLPAQRPLGVPGALPRQDHVELRRAAASRPGARAGPASRSSTPACASSGARAGCTTARAWSSARS